MKKIVYLLLTNLTIEQFHQVLGMENKLNGTSDMCICNITSTSLVPKVVDLINFKIFGNNSSLFLYGLYNFVLVMLNTIFKLGVVELSFCNSHLFIVGKSEHQAISSSFG